MDASDRENWVYLDFDTSTVVTVADPATSTDWDFAIKRSDIAVNGGESGSGGVQIAAFEGHYDAFEENTAAPPHGWVSDTDEDSDGTPEYALAGWYDYDSSDHSLSPHDVLYFVKTVEGDFYRLRFLSYYDDAGTSGVISYEFGPVDPY